MKIIIKADKIDLTPSLRSFTEEKIGSIKKFLGEDEDSYFQGRKAKIEAWVEIGKETRHHQKGPFWRAECQLRFLKKSIRSVAQSDDLRQAIVEVKDDLQRQLEKYKNKPLVLARKIGRELKEKI